MSLKSDTGRVEPNPRAGAAAAVLPAPGSTRDAPGGGPVAPAPPGRKTATLLGDLGSSLVTQALVVSGNLLALRLAARLMSPDQVGELALGRRVLALLTPLLLLGLGVGIPRLLGNLHAQRRLVHATAAGGWLLGMLVGALASALILSSPQLLTRLLFGDAQRTDLVRPLVVMILGQQACMLTFSVFRGRLQIRRANVLQVLHAAVAPLVAVILVGRQGAATTLWTIGAITTLFSLGSGVVLFRSIRFDFASVDLRASITQLGRYGLPRVPGDLAGAGLYALGPLLAAHALQLRAAGMLAIGLQLVTMGAAAVAPLGLVLLPRLSRTLSTGGDARIRQALPAMVGVVAYTSTFLIALGSAFGNTWLRWVLSPEFAIDPLALACLTVAAGANVVVVVLRSCNDAAYFRPVNAINASIALALQVVGWWIFDWAFPGQSLRAICAAIACSFVVQAILTLAAIAHRFQLRAAARDWLRWAVVQVLVGVGIWLASRLLVERGPIAALAAQVASLGIWIGMLWLLRVRSFAAVVHVLRGGRSVATAPSMAPSGDAA